MTWCGASGLPVGASMSLDVCWSISATWYAGRLDPRWERPALARYARLLAAHGLVGPAWQLVPGDAPV